MTDIEHTPNCIVIGTPCGLHMSGHYFHWPCAANYDAEKMKGMYLIKKKPCPSCGILITPRAQHCSKCRGRITGSSMKGTRLPDKWRENVKLAQIKLAKEVRKTSLENLKRIANEYGGKCLSLVYESPKKNLVFECSKGHIFEARTDVIVSKRSWCKKCSVQADRIKGLKRASLIAAQKKGQCISSEYVSSNRRLIWKCDRGHTWENSLSHILDGQWCPICSQFLSENICKSIFEAVFEDKFPKARPAWLIGVKGARLELDGYSPLRKLAFEYQGQQHYRKVGYYKMDDEAFRNRIENDKLKVKLCNERGITLFVIPYSVPYDKIQEYIVEFASNNSIVVNNTAHIPLNTLENHSHNELKDLKELAQKRGGRCVSAVYLGAGRKLLWECKEFHRWESIPANIKKGHWCPYCSGVNKHTIEEMKEYAQSMGGKCLSNAYISNDSKLLWECSVGHMWSAMPMSVINSQTWCPKCARNIKLGIEEVRVLADSKGIELVSKEYVSNGVPLEWKCKNGHIFSMSILRLKKRLQPCPVCDPRKLYEIGDMDMIAQQHNGECLTRTYDSMWTPMQWRCSQGHEWLSKPAYILYKDRWCPECKRQVRVSKLS